MTLPLPQPYPPMEAKSVDALPVGDEWQYEPKWDGFRCVAFREGERIELQSKAGEPLARYFPEVVARLAKLAARRFVLDGELAVPAGASLSFDALLQRIHPAESRIRKLAEETPAILVAFDLLVDEAGPALVDRPLEERRPRLEAFAAKFFGSEPGLALSPVTRDAATALRWLEETRGALDGVIAKRLGVPYRSGDRTGMQKFKPRRTADCVVGGFRDAANGRGIGSLLLGLYDEEGVLHHVGFTSSFAAAERTALRGKLEPLVRPPGFTGRAPGGPSRWNRGKSSEWHPLAPRLVAEVEYDHVSDERFRHGTRFVRWRPDKAPAQCTFEQIEHSEGRLLDLLVRPGRRAGRANRPGTRPAPRRAERRTHRGSVRSPDAAPRGSRRSRP